MLLDVLEALDAPEALDVIYAHSAKKAQAAIFLVHTHIHSEKACKVTAFF